MLYLWGYFGYDGGAPIVLGVCSESYFTSKFSNMSMILKIIFTGSAAAALTSCLLLFITLAWLCKHCKGIEPGQEITRCSINFAYFLASLQLLAAIPPSGYYVTFIMEIGKCSPSSFDQTQFLVFLGLAGLMLLCALFFWFGLACSSCGEQPNDKYRDVETLETAPREEYKPRTKAY